MRATILICFLILAQVSFAKPVVREAILDGIVVIPAGTKLKAPKDMPESMRVTGKFVDTYRRNQKIESIAGASYLSDAKAPRKTGINFPFKGQPFQGVSGIKILDANRFLAIIDNGYGSKKDSADAILSFHEINIDWKNEKAKITRQSYLHDPDHILPFVLVNENTQKRYLTGADLDPESIQIVDQSIFMGDEFGPYLIRTDLNGKLTGFWELTFKGKVLRSPDHDLIKAPNLPDKIDFDIQRSRGFEGMAVSKDHKYLYPMLEGPVLTASGHKEKNAKGQAILRIFEFDLTKESFTPRVWHYALEDASHSIGDFNIVSETEALVIERDNGEGVMEKACGKKIEPNCFNVPAKFKRIYRVQFTKPKNGKPGVLEKRAFVNLLNIQNPKELGKDQLGASFVSGKFTFPFVTIESVDLVDQNHLIVVNDNNLGKSSGRTLGKNDDTEFILIKTNLME